MQFVDNIRYHEIKQVLLCHSREELPNLLCEYSDFNLYDDSTLVVVDGDHDSAVEGLHFTKLYITNTADEGSKLYATLKRNLFWANAPTPLFLSQHSQPSLDEYELTSLAIHDRESYNFTAQAQDDDWFRSLISPEQLQGSRCHIYVESSDFRRIPIEALPDNYVLTYGSRGGWMLHTGKSGGVNWFTLDVDGKISYRWSKDAE